MHIKICLSATPLSWGIQTLFPIYTFLVALFQLLESVGILEVCREGAIHIIPISLWY